MSPLFPTALLRCREILDCFNIFHRDLRLLVRFGDSSIFTSSFLILTFAPFSRLLWSMQVSGEAAHSVRASECVRRLFAHVSHMHMLWLLSVAVFSDICYTSSARTSRGRKFPKGKELYSQTEFAYRMCARPPTSAMPNSFLCCERAFCRSMVVMFCALKALKWSVLMSWCLLRGQVMWRSRHAMWWLVLCHVTWCNAMSWWWAVLLQYYSVLQSTTPVIPCSTKYYSSTTMYYKVLLQYYSVLQSTTPVLPCTSKYYSSTTLYYKVLLLQYYPVLQSTTPVLPCTTKYYYSSTTLYYKVLLQYYPVLQSTTTQVLQSTTPVVLPCSTKYDSSTNLYYKVLLCTTKCYSSTTLYYKVLLQYYSVIESTTPILLRTTPVLPCTTKYYSNTTLYYSSTTLY